MPPRHGWLGPLCAIAGVLGFSFKAILVKLAYASGPVDGTTLLALRMVYSAPLFGVLAWWAVARLRETEASARPTSFFRGRLSLHPYDARHGLRPPDR